MAICQDKLYYDVLSWLPEEQTLSDSTIRQINRLVVSMVGDLDENYAEILCKALEANARKNQIDYQSSVGNLKRQKEGQVEIEYFDSSLNSDIWDSYIKSLDNICPIFGYNRPYTVGIKLSAGKVPKVTDCDCTSQVLDSFFLCSDD